MTTIRRVFQGLVALAVAALVANFYANGGDGYGYDIHPYVYYGVMLAALIVPCFWAVMHLCGGVLFGIAAGGFFDGIKLGLTLGFGMAFGKMWPYLAAAAAGVYVGGGPLTHVVVAAVLAVVLFGLDRALHYFWGSTTAGHNNAMGR